MNRLGYLPEFNESNDSDSTINNRMSDDEFRQSVRDSMTPSPSSSDRMSDDEFRQSVRNAMYEKDTDNSNYITSGDMLRDVGAGIVEAGKGLAENVQGLASGLTGGHAGKLIDDADKAYASFIERTTGFNPYDTPEEIDGLYSETTQKQSKELTGGKEMTDAIFNDFVNTVKKAPENPAAVGRMIMGSLGPMAAGGIYARALKSFGIAGTSAFAIGEGLSMGASAAEEIRGSREDGLLSAGDYPEIAGIVAGGVATGKIGNAVGKAFGASDIDELIAGGVADTVSKGIKQKLASGAIESLEEIGQSGLETILLNSALDKPLTQGLGQAMALGGIAGGTMGVSASFLSSGTQLNDKGEALNPDTSEPYSDKKIGKTVVNVVNAMKRKKVAEKNGIPTDKIDAQIDKAKSHIESLKKEDDTLQNDEVDSALKSIGQQEVLADLEENVLRGVKNELSVSELARMEDPTLSKDESLVVAERIIKKGFKDRDTPSSIPNIKELITSEIALSSQEDYFNEDTSEDDISPENIQEDVSPTQEEIDAVREPEVSPEAEQIAVKTMSNSELLAESQNPSSQFNADVILDEIDVRKRANLKSINEDNLSNLNRNLNENENIDGDTLSDLQTDNTGVISDEDLVTTPEVPEGFQEDTVVPTSVAISEQEEVETDEPSVESPEVKQSIDTSLSEMEKLEQRLDKVSSKEDLSDKDYDTIEDLELRIEKLREGSSSSLPHKLGKTISAEEKALPRDSSRIDEVYTDLDDDISYSFSEKAPISYLSARMGKPTLKVLEGILANTKAKNKTMLVRQKLKEVGATKSEIETIEESLSSLDPDGRGKYEWGEFVNEVKANLAPIESASNINNRYTSHGYENLGYSTNENGEDLSELSTQMYDSIFGEIDEALGEGDNVTIVLQNRPNHLHDALRDELEIFSNYHQVTTESLNENITSYIIEYDGVSYLKSSLETFFEEYNESIAPDAMTNSFKEYRIADTSSNSFLSFPNVESARSHDISDQSIGFIRSFVRGNITHIAEIQSDVSQIGKNELSTLTDLVNSSLTIDEKDVTEKVRGDVRGLVDNFLSSVTDEESKILDDIKQDVEHRDVPVRQRRVEIEGLYSGHLQTKADELITHIKDSFKERLPSSVYSELSESLTHTSRWIFGQDLPKNIDEFISMINSIRDQTVNSLDYSLINGKHRSYKETLDSLNSKDWQRVKKNIDVRLIREAIGEAGEKGESVVRVSSVDTLTKIEGWYDRYDSLKKKHQKTLDKLSKEFDTKEVTDDKGNTWLEVSIPKSYTPLAFAMGESSEGSHSDIANAVSHIAKRIDYKSLQFAKNDKILDFSIKTVKDTSSLPDKLREKVKGKNPQGLFDKNTNTIYIFSNNNGSVDEAVGTVAHELIGHVGLRKVLGKSYDNLLVRMLNSDESMLKGILSKVNMWSVYQEQWIKDNGEDALSALPDSQKFISKDVNGDEVTIPFEVALRLADEYMAELARDNVFTTDFIKDRVGSGSLRKARRKKREGLLKFYVKKVKHLIRKVLGKHSDSLSEEDLLEMLAASTDSVFKDTRFDYTVIATEQAKDSLNSGIRAAFFAKRMQEEMGGNTQAVSDMVRASVKGDFGSINKSGLDKMTDKIGLKIRNNPFFSKFFSDGGIPFSKYVHGIEAMHSGSIRQNELDTAELFDLTRGLSKANNSDIFLYYTTRDHAPLEIPLKDDPKDDARLKELLAKTKQDMVDIGAQMVGLGLLDSETYLENEGRYLQTQYVKHLNQSLGGVKTPSFMNYLKKKDPNLTNMDKAEKGMIRDPGYLVASSLMVMSRDVALHQMYDSLSQASSDNYLGWVLGESDKIESDDKSYTRVKIRSELDRYEHLVEGHMKAFDNSATNYSEEEFEHVKSKYDFFKDLQDKSDQLIIDQLTNSLREQQGREPTQEEVIKYQNSMYSRMPTSKRYGKLSGQLVLTPIQESFFSLDAVMQELDTMKFKGSRDAVAHYTKIWKTIQVGLNPPSIARNILGNFVLLDISTNRNAGSITSWVGETVKNTVNKTPDRYMRYARMMGLDTTTLSAHELYSLSRDFKTEIALEESEGNSVTDAWPMLQSSFVKTLEKAGRFFGWQESLFKTVALRDYVMRWEEENVASGVISKGQTIENLPEDQKKAVLLNAATHANDSLFDYSKVNKAADVIRNSPLGAPFFTFMYKMFPVAVESTARRPWKMGQYVALPYMISHIAKMMFDWDDDDLEEYMAKQALYLKHNKSVAVFPAKDPQGNIQVLDLSATIPFAKFINSAVEMYDTSNFSDTSSTINSLANAGKIGLVDTLGIFGTPAFQIGTYATNNTLNFTGKPINTPGAHADQKMYEGGQFIWNMIFPSWLGSKGSVSKTISAVTGEKSFNMDIPKVTPLQAGLSYGGINVKTSVPEDNVSMNKGVFKKRFNDYKKAYRSAYVDAQRKGNDMSIVKNKYKLEGVRLKREYNDYLESIK